MDFTPFEFTKEKRNNPNGASFLSFSRPAGLLRTSAIHLEYIFNNKNYKDYEEFEMRIILDSTDLAAGEKVILQAALNYRRMPDSYAEYLGIPTRPTMEVSRDERILTIAQ